MAQAEATSIVLRCVEIKVEGTPALKYTYSAIIPQDSLIRKIKAYANMDDQSNKSLAMSAFLIPSMSQRTT